jgi:hypothetical protein
MHYCASAPSMRAHPTTPSFGEKRRNWDNFELLAPRRMHSRNLQIIKDLAIAAGRPDIGNRHRRLGPANQMDGAQSIDRLHPNRALNK